MGNAHTLGSHWMNFDETADAYPTDGKGGSGTGSITTASHLKNVSECIVDGVLITHITGATLRNFTLNDAAGNELLTTEVTTINGVTHGGQVNTVPTWIRFGEHGLLITTGGGFTMESDSSAATGTVFYRIIRTTPS